MRRAIELVTFGRRYAFRYLGENGQWANDDSPHDYCGNDTGALDCVLDLTSAAAAARTR